MHPSRPNVSKLETKQRHRPIQGRSRARPGPSPARPVLACTGKWAIGYPGGQAGFEFVTSCVGQPLSVVHLHWSTRDPVAIAEDAAREAALIEQHTYSSIGRRVSDFSYLPARQPIQPVSQPVKQSLGQVQVHGYCPQLERGPLVLLLIRLSRLFRHEDPLPQWARPRVTWADLQAPTNPHPSVQATYLR